MNHHSLALEKLSPEVFVSTHPFPSFGPKEQAVLDDALKASSKGRVRICTHKTTEDRQQEMFISFTGDNYIRPSRHLGKDESLHVLHGQGQYLFFNEKGDIVDTVLLGEFASEDKFYCRINRDVLHALVIYSDKMTVHETTAGPFLRADTEFATWSPEDGAESAPAYLAALKSYPKTRRPMLKMRREAEEVFIADEPIVSVGREEIEFLKSVVPTTTRKRVRLCAHTSSENTLHEMFVVYTNCTYVRPNLHLGKDEALHILEGEADFFFFDEQGNILEVIHLGDATTGRQIYCRVPAHKYHTIVMNSPTLVIHEVTPGPFVRSDTVWADWAPEENDLEGVSQFVSRLSEAAQSTSDAR
jgi:cupin fold WbuC family metalloprotein